MLWGRSEPCSPGAPSSISVSNAWLFVMLCVRCICVEGAPAPGRRWGAGDGDGCEGDLRGNPSSHHCSAWEAAGSGGTEVLLGTVLGQEPVGDTQR